MSDEKKNTTIAAAIEEAERANKPTYEPSRILQEEFEAAGGEAKCSPLEDVISSARDFLHIGTTVGVMNEDEFRRYARTIVSEARMKKQTTEIELQLRKNAVQREALVLEIRERTNLEEFLPGVDGVLRQPKTKADRDKVKEILVKQLMKSLGR